MFNKLKRIKNLAIIFISIFLLFLIASNVFLIITNIRLGEKLETFTNEYSYCRSNAID